MKIGDTVQLKCDRLRFGRVIELGKLIGVLLPHTGPVYFRRCELESVK